MSKSDEKAFKLVINGGTQIFPPNVLPPPSLFRDEVNAFVADPRRCNGLGYFDRLSDRLILKMLKWLNAGDLLTLSLCSTHCNVFANDEERWKRLCIKRHRGDFYFQSSWKRTYYKAHDRGGGADKDGDTRMEDAQWPPRHLFRAQVVGFRSILLYNEWYRSHISIDHFRSIPKESVPRVVNPSVEEFISKFGQPNAPVVLEGALEHWQARHSLNFDALMQRFPETRFKMDEVDDRGKKFKMSFRNYAAYARENHDEDPIYLFDPSFLDRAPELKKEYRVPKFFPEDFFAVLGEDDRPDYAWLVVGPERSGSPFHIDPYRTSAWNAVLSGAKRWLLYPPEVRPPGVPVEEDEEEGFDYDAPEPIKYLVEEYPHIPKSRMPMECITKAGDLIYVPSGWWHMVLNLEDTCAVTQNFCSSFNFNFVFTDMKLPSNKKIFKKFRKSLAALRPDLAQQYNFQTDFCDNDASYKMRALKKT